MFVTGGNVVLFVLKSPVSSYA